MCVHMRMRSCRYNVATQFKAVEISMSVLESKHHTIAQSITVRPEGLQSGRQSSTDRRFAEERFR